MLNRDPETAQGSVVFFGFGTEFFVSRLLNR